MRLTVNPQLVLIDGRFCPNVPYHTQAIIKGDQTESAISAASIVAKVVRDQQMQFYDQHYPGYGFAQHKGYPTRLHMEALKKRGVTIIHRRSYQPVRDLLIKDVSGQSAS